MGSEETGTPDQPRAFDLRHHHDSGDAVARLTAWLGTLLGPGSEPRAHVTAQDIANGMSSSTLLFDLEWTRADGPTRAALVARVAPDQDEVTVFPTYDLTAQFDTMSAVAAASTVPVPAVRWIEDTGTVLGQPFFVMDRVDGAVPPDMLPYTFGDNWLFDATDSDRQHLQDAMIDVLVDLHGIDNAPSRFSSLADGGAPQGYLRRHLSRTRAWYDWSVAQNGCRSELVEAALDQLDGSTPDEPERPVLSWGDARIGNVIFEDFTPVAVLDWEMADLGPRELDLVWLTYSHRVFQDLAEGLDLAGLPDFLAEEQVAAAYEARSGHAVRDLQWHTKYAAVRWACAFLRTGAREAHLNGNPLPDDGDTLLHNRPSLAALVEGTYRSKEGHA